MKKTIVGLLSISILSMSVVANAYVAEVKFSGNDIMGYATDNLTGNKLIGDGYIAMTAETIRTYSTTTTTANSAGFNKWLDSLQTGQGIKSFNLWLQDGASNQAAMWGETIALTDPYSTAITVNAPTGWIGYAYTLQNEWGPAWTGRQLITFEAISSDYYLRPNNGLEFSFRADIMGNDGATGPDYQMWVGSGDIAGVNGESFYQRAVNAEATAVPGPAAILPFVGGLIVAARKRRK